MDDTKAILAAIEYAQSNGVHTVRFAPGVYEFKDQSGWEASERGKRSSYIVLQDIKDLEIAGAMDSQGKATTFWVKDNDLKEGQPTVMSLNHGSNVTIRNIALDMAPYYYSAGRIISVNKNVVTIEVLPGHPLVDGQNIHGVWLSAIQKRSDKDLLATSSRTLLTAGTDIILFENNVAGIHMGGEWSW